MEEKQAEHNYLEVNGDFRMRELDKSDLDQFNALLQYAFQITTKELFETGWAQDEIKYAKRPILEEAYVIGWLQKPAGIYDCGIQHEDECLRQHYGYGWHYRSCHLS